MKQVAQQDAERARYSVEKVGYSLMTSKLLIVKTFLDPTDCIHKLHLETQLIALFRPTITTV